MRNQPTFAFKKRAFFAICMLLLSVNILTAQENGYYEIKANLISDDNSPSNTDNSREAFYNLILNLHPTAYVENSAIKIGGNSGYSNLPILKLTFHDTKSFSILNQANAQYNDVELMTIKVLTVADLNNRLNLVDVGNLNQLKYIYIECYFDCTESQLKGFITYDNPNIRIFYKVSKPS